MCPNRRPDKARQWQKPGHVLHVDLSDLVLCEYSVVGQACTVCGERSRYAIPVVYTYQNGTVAGRWTHHLNFACLGKADPFSRHRQPSLFPLLIISRTVLCVPLEWCRYTTYYTTYTKPGPTSIILPMSPCPDSTGVSRQSV